MAELLIAKTNTIVHYRGRRIKLHQGKTVAEVGADIVRDHPNLWEPLTVDYPARSGRVEQTTAAPGEQRDVEIPGTRKVREWARENGYNVPDKGKLPGDVVEAYRAAHARQA